MGTLADGDAAVEAGGLSLLVESHHHNGCAHAAADGGAMEEYLFALLEGNGVDNTLSLYATQGSLDDLPARGVNHHGHAGNVGFGGEQAQEMHHLGTAVKQAVVNIDVEHLRTILHLRAGNLEGCGIVLLANKTKEAARARHVAALADVEKIALGRDGQGLKAREREVRVGRCWTARRHGQAVVHHEGRVLGDVSIRGAATAADDIDQPLADVFAHLLRHLLGRLVVAAKGVGQARIGIGRYIIRRVGSQLSEEGEHVRSTKRTVEAHGEYGSMADGSQKGFEGLARKGAATLVGNGDAQHEGYGLAMLKGALNSVDGRLGIERIKDGFDEQGIHATIQQSFHLFAVSLNQFIKG